MCIVGIRLLALLPHRLLQPHYYAGGGGGLVVLQPTCALAQTRVTSTSTDWHSDRWKSKYANGTKEYTHIDYSRYNDEGNLEGYWNIASSSDGNNNVTLTTNVHYTFYRKDTDTYKKGTLVLEPVKLNQTKLTDKITASSPNPGEASLKYVSNTCPWKVDDEIKQNVTRIITKQSTIDTTTYGINFSNYAYYSGLFSSLKQLQVIDLRAAKFTPQDTTLLVKADYMFASCYQLQSIILNDTHTFSTVNTFESMFQDCVRLAHIVSKPVTETINYEELAKKDCDMSGLKNFDTSNATSMHGMFMRCHSITNFNFKDYPKFITAKVTDFSMMFAGAGSEVDGFAYRDGDFTSKPGMFNLKKLDCSSFDTSSATNMSGMFRGQEGLEELNISGKFTTKKVKNVVGMFTGAHALKKLTINKNTSFSSNIGLAEPNDTIYSKIIKPNFEKDNKKSYSGSWQASDANKTTMKSFEFSATKKLVKLKDALGDTDTLTLTWAEGTNEPAPAPQPNPQPAPQPKPPVPSGGSSSSSSVGSDVSDTASETTDMYRLYNPNSGEHLFTINAAEKTQLVALGWRYEGVIGKVHTKTGDAVYRLYNPNSGDHHYTMDVNEVARCKRAGWVDEGIKFYSAGKTGMVSMYNPYATRFYHHYTSNELEIEAMQRDGWKKETVKWYVL